MSTYWPLTGLRVRTGPLELRIPTAAECEALAEAAAREPTNPGVPFLADAADSPVRRGRRTLQFLWRELGTWGPDGWSLSLAVFDQGELVGTQNVRAVDFAREREVMTGVWIFQDRSGQGLGTRSRSALLHLIFDGLGAHRAVHRAAADNPASLALARRLGYQEDPATGADSEGTPPSHRFSLTADRWRSQPRPEPVHVTGLSESLFMFGHE
ncbi:hypothetical protein QR77_11770 [Streptomyces sp. 150FB]|uniref:GNAT family N-acetyltransferase n=1 Tax=Streptomyces sp. 150FB TaxID=1576605 RepID=UPI000588F8F2|nr:GNAT family protein [Streptomyces sp. 150FB]KIF74473.1 hypothetical protein QR77_11770 [Streptomyces sp. 150FB]